MMKQAPDINTAVQEVQDTIEQGDQAASKQDYFLAIAEHESAAIDNDYNAYYSYETMERIFTRGRFQGNSLYEAYIAIDLALSTKLAVTYLKIENYSQAYRWIRSALVLVWPSGRVSWTDSGGAACAAIYSTSAQASEGLGLVGRAVEEMVEAVRYDPEDPKLATELVRLKEKIAGGGA